MESLSSPHLVYPISLGQPGAWRAWTQTPSPGPAGAASLIIVTLVDNCDHHWASTMGQPSEVGVNPIYGWGNREGRHQCKVTQWFEVDLRFVPQPVSSTAHRRVSDKAEFVEGYSSPRSRPPSEWTLLWARVRPWRMAGEPFWVHSHAWGPSPSGLRPWDGWKIPPVLTEMLQGWEGGLREGAQPRKE